MNGLRLDPIVAVSVSVGLLITLFTAGPAIAQSKPELEKRVAAAAITLNAEAGYGTYTRPDNWTPVYVTLSASEPLDGELAVSTSADRSRLYGESVNATAGSVKHVILYAPPTTEPIEVLFLSHGTVLASTSPSVLVLNSQDRLSLVISQPPDGWNLLADLPTPFGGQTRVIQMQPEQIPEMPAALDAVDVMVFDNVDTSALDEAQRTAIQTWVLGGGHLILGGGPGAQLTVGGFNDFAPAQVGATLDSSPVGILRALLTPNSVNVSHVISQAAILSSTTSEAPDVMAPVVTLRAAVDDARTLISSLDTPLVMRRNLGRGMVDQLAFDPTLAPIHDWPDRSLLFAGLLGGQVSSTHEIGPLKDENGAVSAARALPGAALPPFLIVAGFLLLYVLTIGPINFYFLRKLNRLAWAWVTIPGIVLLFVALGYATGFRLRGNEPEVHRLSVVSGEAGLIDGRSQTIIGLFSPRRTTLNVDVANNLALEVQPNPNVQNTLSFQIGSPNRLDNVIATNSDVRTFYLEGESPLPDIQADMRLVAGHVVSDTARLEGMIHNLSNVSLTDCTLVVGKDFHVVGNIGPHQQVRASAELLLGRPQMGFIMPENPLLPSSPGLGTPSLGSSFGRGAPSSAPILEPGSPFDLSGASLSDELLNWRDYHGDRLKEQAERNLVSAVFDLPDATLGNGAFLACWVDYDRSGVTVPGAQYTDHGLRIWHLPVRPFLVDSGVALPSEVFQWSVLSTSSTLSIDDSGLDMDIGDHIIGLSPWLNLRTSGPVHVSLLVDTSLDTPLSALQATSVWLYDWNKQQFTQVIAHLDEPNALGHLTGAYLSPSGELRARFDVRDDQITLINIQALVEVP